MEIETGLPLTITKNIDSKINFYIWSIEGKCLHERQTKIKHPEIVGLTMHELAEAVPIAANEWEVAVSGQAATWIDDASGTPLLCGFIPVAPIAGLSPVAIVGFCAPMSEGSIEFLERGGIKLKPFK